MLCTDVTSPRVMSEWDTSLHQVPLPDKNTFFPMTLCPDTFDQVFESALNGCPHAASAFTSTSDLFVCARPERLHSHTGTLWIFDADDTYWEDNIFYKQLAKDVISRVQTQVPTAESSVLWDLIHTAEHETVATQGYGPIGYERSLRRALQLAATHYQAHLQIDESFFKGVVPLLSSVPDSISLDTVHTLRHLRETGGALALFTMGVREIQQRKIYNSGLAKLFDAVAITHKKVPSAYEQLVDTIGYQGNDIRMVGNSLKSDILPAVTLGWKAYHYVNPNTWHAGNNAEVPREKYEAIHSLTELLGDPRVRRGEKMPHPQF